MSVKHSLFHDRRGATAVEFALILPFLLAMIITFIECSRLLWTKQALQEAASHTARCMAIGSEGCDTLDGAALFAQKRASKMGVRIAPEAVSVASNQTCNGLDNMNRAALDIPFNSPFQTLVSVIPERVSAEACFPSLQ